MGKDKKMMEIMASILNNVNTIILITQIVQIILFK